MDSGGRIGCREGEEGDYEGWSYDGHSLRKEKGLLFVQFDGVYTYYKGAIVYGRCVESYKSKWINSGR
jgi:hypothetical protein